MRRVAAKGLVVLACTPCIAQTNTGPAYILRESSQFGSVYEIEIPTKDSASKASENLRQALEKCVGPTPVIPAKSLAPPAANNQPKNLFATLLLPVHRKTQIEYNPKVEFKNYSKVESSWRGVAQASEVSALILLKKPIADLKPEKADLSRISFLAKGTVAVLSNSDQTSRVRLVLPATDTTDLAVAIAVRLPSIVEVGRELNCQEFEKFHQSIVRDPAPSTSILEKAFGFRRTQSDPDVIWANLSRSVGSDQTTGARDMAESIRVTYDPFPSPYRDLPPIKPKPTPGR